jgi:transcriptional regulator GlxA family with amidase domain
LIRRNPHADAVVRACERWLSEHFREPRALDQVVRQAKIPERTLKRRFKAATGTTLIEHLQDIRIEHAKQLLESGRRPIDEISGDAGYEDASFFRRLFKRRTGLSPSQYRRMFQPMNLA